MRGRRSRAALEHEISQLAEHALEAAREVGHHAGPAIQHSAEGLSHTLEKAAATLAETAERFAESGEHRASGATRAARERLAVASERFAETIRPKKKHHRVRNLLVAAALVGGIVAFVQSPLRAKLTARLFGPPPEDEPPSITLPNDEPARTSDFERHEPVDAGASTPPASAGGDGVGTVSSIRADAAQD